MKRKFLLCFHDFSVWNCQRMVPVLESLKDLVGRPFTVLVIPSTEGAEEDAVARFREFLSKLAEEGFELALHGYKHKAEFSQGRSYKGLIAMRLTQREAEFSGLSEYESSRLLHAGLDCWNALLNQKPVAFVPPTWYSNKYLPGQVRSEGMVYEGRSLLINDKGKKRRSLVTSFAGIPSFAEKLAFAFGRFILKVPFGLPRIALHPVDFPKNEEAIRDLLRVAINRRQIAYYRDL